ncbi:MAG: hypothetical protein JW820_21055 [Spirochaetales bacterium]|nr:hypothetical protein [Spirochaetales bacterium]
MRFQYALVVLLVLTTSCDGDYETTRGLVSKKNIEGYLTSLQKGVAGNNSFPSDPVMLAELEEYIDARGSVIYRDNADLRFLHEGLIELYRAQFLRSFYTLRTYIDKSGNLVQPFYHVGIKLETQASMSGTEILGRAALATRSTFPHPLDKDQQGLILFLCALYPYRQMAACLTDDMLESDDERTIVRAQIKYHQEFVLTRKDIEALYGVFILEEVDVEELLERKSRHDIAELDYLVAFHIHPYHQDFGKAARYADMRDPGQWYEPKPHSRVENLMRAYLGVDRYPAVIDLYDRHSYRFSEAAASMYHLNLLVSAAYAGLGDLDTSLQYLEKEFALAKIYPGYSSSNQTTYDLPDRGDMLVSIFELVFVFEEFDQFEKAGRFAEMQAVVENNVARFKHLDVFNRK